MSVPPCSSRPVPCTVPPAPEQIRPVGEVEFVQGQAAASASGIYGEGRAAAAIIGAANLDIGAEVESVLEELQEASPQPVSGGISVPHRATIPTPAHREPRAPPGPHGQPRIPGRRPRRWPARAWSWTSPPTSTRPGKWPISPAPSPDLPIIFNHIGGLLRVGPYANRDDEVLAQWRESIDTVSACPNIYMKLGGVGQPRYGFRLARVEPTHRLRRLGRGPWPLDELLHRKVRPRNAACSKATSPVDKVFLFLQRAVSTPSSACRPATPPPSGHPCSTTRR